MTVRFAPWLLAAVWSTAHVVRADGPRVVVLPPVHNLPGSAGPVVATIRGDVVAALEAAGWTVVPGDVADACVPPAPGASDLVPQRLGEIASACGTRAAAGPFVEASAIGYVVRLVVAGADGSEIAALETECDFCAESEMVALWGLIGSGLPAAPAPEPAVVDPIEAAAPEIPPDVVPFDGARDDEAGASISDVPWWFWAGAGAAAGAVGAGAALVAIDGDPTCDGPLASCPDLYDTDVGGWSLVAAGAAAAAALAVGLYFSLEGPVDGPVVDDEVGAGAFRHVFLGLGPAGVFVSGAFGP